MSKCPLAQLGDPHLPVIRGETVNLPLSTRVFTTRPQNSAFERGSRSLHRSWRMRRRFLFDVDMLMEAFLMSYAKIAAQRRWEKNRENVQFCLIKTAGTRCGGKSLAR
jgi:hypothetical protein